MKKKAVLIISIIAVAFLIYFIGSGFMKNSSVYIENYTLSADGIIPFYWVVWSLFSIKDLKGFGNGFFS